MNQVVEIRLQFFARTTNARSANDDAHLVWYAHALHCFTQLSALIAFNATRDSACTCIIWHQYKIAASQAHLSRQGCAFVAALFFVNLNDDFLAFFQNLFDIDATGARIFAEIFSGDLFEGEEAMAFGAKIHKRGFEARLDTGDLTLVDVRFLLLATTRLNVKVIQFLAVYKCNTQLFCLSGVYQHSFHAVRITLLGNVPAWQRRTCLLCLLSSEG